LYFEELTEAIEPKKNMTKRSVFMYHEDCCKINPYSNGPKKKKEITWQG